MNTTTKTLVSDLDLARWASWIGAAGAVLLALASAARVRIVSHSINPAQWAEMETYLRRRGVTVRFDNGEACPVARRVF